MCPKAAVFAFYGIDVFPAVGVSAQVHGTKVIAKDPTAKHIRYLKDQAIQQKKEDGTTQLAKPQLNAHPYDVIIDWIRRCHDVPIFLWKIQDIYIYIY